MAVRGFLNILNEQLTEINNEQDESSITQGVAFEILGIFIFNCHDMILY